MKYKRLVWLPLAVLSLPAAAGGPDQLWQVTVQMNDKVSGATMTSQPQPQCLHRLASSDQIVPLQKACRMLDQRTEGTKTYFRFECTGAQRLSGEGELDRPTPDSYHGEMHMQGAGGEGRVIDLLMKYSGKRVGDCTAEEPLPASGQ